ncbi:MarR family winged helix-turn-helix transcriptional regulator [Diplocloster hominis]|uniref:MarR family winged helix-turn-helix transcriptional regulator n=1 Tax=Diplocloster hominis TaxID=3079010 RepID=UPI0031BAF9D4
MTEEWKEGTEDTMETDWMGRHRDLVEKFIRLFNVYARRYTTVSYLENTNVETSSAQIQTLEYILEADGSQKMSEIASRMGITRGTFSNNVKKLVEKGYLQKSNNPDNKKDVFVTVTAKGKQAYQEYSDYIYRLWFHRMFELADQIPEEYLDTFKELLDGFTEAFNKEGGAVSAGEKKDAD